jgi:uroporphyrinogen-III synthase
MRVLVTRSEPDGLRTARKLADLGHEAILAPVIEIVSSEQPMPEGSYDAVIVTSAHAVPALQAAASHEIPVFAVGERTAQALREAGFSDVLAAEGDAVSLSRLVRSRLDPGAALLHATGRHRKDEPALSLTAAGFRLLTWETYEATAVGTLPRPVLDELRTGQIGAALHYSRRSAELFVRLLDQAGIALPDFPHLCLSADVAIPLRVRNGPALVARQPSEEALLSLLEGLP